MSVPYSTKLESQLLKEGEQDLSGLTVHRDLVYIDSPGYNGDTDKLDIFMPQAAENVPVVLYFHGGALKGGSKIDGEALAARIVRHGIGVVSANYRLTPAVRHPGHVQDAAAAFAWVRNNIYGYGGDPERIYLTGHSAGGYLAVLLALDPAYIENHGLDLASIKGVAPISPFLYVEETAKTRPVDVWGEDPDEWLSASVTPSINPGKPPMLMIYADGDEDWRREQNERFVREMKRSGNSLVASYQVSGRDHFSIINRMLEQDDETGSLIIDFINRAGHAR